MGETLSSDGRLQSGKRREVTHEHQVEQGLQSQIRNIEAQYGRPVDDWVELIRASGRTRHSEIVAMLKGDFGLSHGAANRVALVAMDALAAKAERSDPEAVLYAGNKAALLPIHAHLMESVVRDLGPDVEVAPKKGYCSLPMAGSSSR